MTMRAARKPPAEQPVLAFEDQAAFAAWLKDHHADSPGIWLRLAKAASGLPSVTYAEAIDVALCYGWIDGQKRAGDDKTWLQKFTRRRPKSIWSKINRQKAEGLIESGRMAAAGLREVERAKADGRWQAAYEGQRTMSVPDDFQAELDRNSAARDFFATLNGANRYAVLFRIHTAKKAETRAKRIRQLIDMLARGEKIYP
jgi:uncharacterized protein YdeI (YjbR/CyaY-like superfamily)